MRAAMLIPSFFLESAPAIPAPVVSLYLSTRVLLVLSRSPITLVTFCTVDLFSNPPSQLLYRPSLQQKPSTELHVYQSLTASLDRHSVGRNFAFWSSLASLHSSVLNALLCPPTTLVLVASSSAAHALRLGCSPQHRPDDLAPRSVFNLGSHCLGKHRPQVGS